MKNLFNRILSLFCAVTLLICALSVCAAAEEDVATPTDLNTEEEIFVPENTADTAEQEDESSDGPVESVEILIAKNMVLGESWEGVTRDTRLVVLKLDIDKAQTVHIIVEGKNAWANVQKSDRTEENLRKVLTDPETNRAIIIWEAEQGSYLITIGPEEPNIMAKVQVAFLDDVAYEAWEKALEEETVEPTKKELVSKETVGTEETEEKIIDKKADQADNQSMEESIEEKNTRIKNVDESFAEEDQTYDNVTDMDSGNELEEIDKLQSDRSIKLSMTWDSDQPKYGSIAKIQAELIGYDNLKYSLQWQKSMDDTNWNDVNGATQDTLIIVLSEETDHCYWRIIVFVEEELLQELY